MPIVTGKAYKQRRVLIYGKGINDFNESISYNRVKIKEYELWKNMLQRCYSKKYISLNPTYIGCYVEDYLLSFTNFYNFIHTLKGHDLGYQMDKDLLVKGNKCYSRDTIVFVPKEINTFLTTGKYSTKNSELPIGVYYDKERQLYNSNIILYNKRKHLGRFNTPVEAFNVYKEAKEQQAKVLAERWKDKIDERAYNALMNYKVEITD